MRLEMYKINIFQRLINLRRMFLGTYSCQEQVELVFDSNKRILVISPHPDDETIGCFGVLKNFGRQCDVLCLTKGERGDPNLLPEEVAEIRYEEFSTVMSRLDIKNWRMLDGVDGKLNSCKHILNGIRLQDYDCVFIPNFVDQHPDHIAVGMLLKQCFKGPFFRPSIMICMYEVWSALAIPNAFIDISEYHSDKINMIRCYESQVKHIRYDERTIALNFFRGMSVNRKYVESYCVLNSKEFISLMR